MRTLPFFDLPAEKLKKLSEIEFFPVECRYLRITWDDSASPRVPMPQSVAARLVSAGALPPRLQVPLQFERRRSEPGRSRYRIRLPGPRLPVTEIQLSSGRRNVLRDARITEARLSGDEMVPAVLGTATLRREMLGDLEAAAMSIAIEPPREAQLDLVIEDGNNRPLDLTGITAVFAYLPWIYFESADTGALTAGYGYDNAQPRYDLRGGAPVRRKGQNRGSEMGGSGTARAAAESATPLKAQTPLNCP